MAAIIRIRSGNWTVRAQRRDGSPALIFERTDKPGDELVVHFALSPDRLADDHLRALAQDPDYRVWADASGRRWRIHLDNPLGSDAPPWSLSLSGGRLVFRVPGAAGTELRPVAVGRGLWLGELTDAELEALLASDAE